MAGFRRRLRITPTVGRVTAALEDDYHCMAVILDHDARFVTGVHAVMDRWPWSTCPGALEVVTQTFQGAPLSEMRTRGQKSSNCTHLYDLALYAAGHAGEALPLTYDVFVSDPEDARVVAELRLNGAVLLSWVLEDSIVTSPAEVAGTNLFHLRSWIASQPAQVQEAARILQWATIIARGRSIPIEAQSNASQLPPNCYSFQPERAQHASRVGQILDFSEGPGEPLGHFSGTKFDGPRQAGRVVWSR